MGVACGLPGDWRLKGRVGAALDCGCRGGLRFDPIGSRPTGADRLTGRYRTDVADATDPGSAPYPEGRFYEVRARPQPLDQAPVALANALAYARKPAHQGADRTADYP